MLTVVCVNLLVYAKIRIVANMEILKYDLMQSPINYFYFSMIIFDNIMYCNIGLAVAPLYRTPLW